MLGNLLNTAGQPDEAAEAYRSAIRTNPHLVAARYKLANLLVRSGKEDEAAEQCVAACSSTALTLGAVSRREIFCMH